MDEIYKHENDIYYSGMFQFDIPSSFEVYINEIYLDDLTIISIRLNKPGFNNGYYKILDNKFDYEYINKLIIDYQK
ncbi:hypothetical protein [Sporosalibacterium faouarense]|uniref:hypothetical protein n=1 Tax=Sporosalibacterium faouarense TaxID=516123 RepID=UPI00192CD090|nr:hypothetical protein [Sporosalibacterium faouarense]